MLNCKQMSVLVSQSLDRKLSLRERGAVRLHLLICTACARFERQMRFLQRVAREYNRRGEQWASETLRLSAQARIRILNAIMRES